jgi:hypothetical protein
MRSWGSTHGTPVPCQARRIDCLTFCAPSHKYGGLLSRGSSSSDPSEALLFALMMEQLTRAEFEAGQPCPGCGVPWQGTLVDLCKLEVDALEMMRAAPIDPDGPLFERHVQHLLAIGLVRWETERLGITRRGRTAAAALRREEARWDEGHGRCRTPADRWWSDALHEVLPAPATIGGSDRPVRAWFKMATGLSFCASLAGRQAWDCELDGAGYSLTARTFMNRGSSDQRS